ncbi:response regulator [Rhodospirillum sp. A1_3_36]|uniref:response regulator n=1 Tax=Rhodospirillum sp. A1_3_36 TaxID=3391666 RepID=UPI0039A65C72
MTETSASMQDPVTGTDAILCEQPEDLRTPAARQVMRRILAPFLSEQTAVPMVLLHSPSLLAALSIDDRRTNWMDRIARLQAEGQDDGAVDSRRRALQALFQVLAKQTNAATARLPDQPMNGKTFAMLSKTFGPTPDDQEKCLLGLVVAKATGQQETLVGKAEAVLDMVSGQDAPETAQILDPFLADFLRDPQVTQSFLGDDQTSRMDILGDLVNLAQGTKALASGRPPLALRLDFVLREMNLPECREALTECLLSLLRDPTPFVALPGPDGELSIRDIFDELMAISQIAERLKEQQGPIGGAKAIKLLDNRIIALTTGERLTRILEDKGTLERLRTLFRFQRLGLASKSRRVLGEHIVDAIEDRDFPGYIRDEIPKTDDQMMALGELADLVSQAALGEATRARLVDTLDGVQYHLIRTGHLFTELRKDTMRDIRAYIRVLELAAGGAFVPGRCDSEAKDLLGRYARHPDFMRVCLTHLQAAGGTGVSMDDLTHKLRAAGVSFRDAGAARVLVVDDEESAAAYVRMVLDDMGVQNVIVATDGLDAMRRIEGQEKDIDLIICDWMMPNMSGLEFLQQVRSISPKVPFLMVTALATVETVKKAMEHEVTAYIAKPFPPEQLEEKILVLLNRGHDPAANGLL